MAPSNRKRPSEEQVPSPKKKAVKPTSDGSEKVTENLDDTEDIGINGGMISDSECESVPVQPKKKSKKGRKASSKTSVQQDSLTQLEKNSSGTTRSSKRTRNIAKLISDSEIEDEDENVEKRKKKKNREHDDDDEDFQIERQNHVPRPRKLLASRLEQEDIERSFTNSSSGVMKSLQMYNFMCHTNFYKEWHPNLNFITGENGSGKSALLSGILIGLGARALVTSRTKSTASLIQKGKDSARTLITLLNYGHLPEIKYGQELVIERTLSKNGSSGYRIKTLDKWRALRRNELDYILLALNIQLDNPVAILNQEVARNFLRSKDPKSKYTLFYQGTLLAKLYNLLAESKTDIDASQKNLEIHKEIIVQIKKSVDKLEEKKNAYDNLKHLKDTVASLQLEYFWALVHDEEEKQTGLQRQVKKQDDAIASFTKSVNDLVTKRTGLENETMPSEQETQAVQQQVKEKEGLLEAKRSELSRTQRTIQDARLKMRGNEPEIRNKSKDIKEATAALERLKSRSVQDGERAMQEFEEKKAKLEEEKSAIVQTLKTLKQDGDQFKNGADSARERMNEIEDNHKSLNQQLESRRRNLSSLQDSSANKYAVYGPKIQSLLGKIQANAHRFKKQPRGPMGSHFTVKDPKYAAVIENVLGSFVTSFLVDNGDDLTLMRKLVSETWGREQLRQSGPFGSGRQPSILINKFANQVHDISKGIARVEGHPTLLDLLDIENQDHIVINALCDYQSAEKILMFESYKTAAVIMKDRSKCPSTCKNGHTLDWYRFTPVPNYSAQALKQRGNRPNFLQTSKTAQISNLRIQIKELQADIAKIKPSLEQSKKEEAELRKQFTQRSMEYNNNKKLLFTINQSLTENERTKYKAPDIASHVEDIKEMELELEQINTQNEASKNMIEELKPKIAVLEAEKREIEKEIPKLLESMTSAEEKKEKAQKQIDSINAIIRRIKGKKEQTEQVRAPLVKKLEACEKDIKESTERAEANGGERVDTERSSEDVKKEFEGAKKQISEMEKLLGCISKIKADLKIKKAELKTKVNEYQPTHKSFVSLRDLIDSQLAFLFKKRAEISNGLSVTFLSLAAQRGYKGQMLIDHDKQELHFFICPDKTSSCKTTDTMQKKGSSNKESQQQKKSLVEYSLGLSGGERSFATICFIMSLWQVMECPFYMLDEFDVFMDAFNRKTSQGALIRHAKSFKRNQFFLFTPLDLIEAPSHKEACVLRLFPPERGNVAPNPGSPATDNEAENVDPSSVVPQSQTSKSVAGPSSSSRARNAAMALKNKPARR